MVSVCPPASVRLKKKWPPIGCGLVGHLKFARLVTFLYYSFAVLRSDLDIHIESKGFQVGSTALLTCSVSRLAQDYTEVREWHRDGQLVAKSGKSGLRRGKLIYRVLGIICDILAERIVTNRFCRIVALQDCRNVVCLEWLLTDSTLLRSEAYLEKLAVGAKINFGAPPPPPKIWSRCGFGHLRSPPQVPLLL